MTVARAFDTLSTCFALLDDADATSADPRSRLYTQLVDTLVRDDADSLSDWWERMTPALQQGLHPVGLFDYETGARWQEIGSCGASETTCCILLFKSCKHLTADQVLQWLDQQQQRESSDNGQRQAHPCGIAQVRDSVDQAEFCKQIERIHAYLEAGDIYQINYTYRIRFDAFGSLCELYRRLRERQPTQYGALIALPDGRAVLSLSPELFIRHQQRELTAQPMKGTAAAGDAHHHAERAAALAVDDKNRAENLMIVDLLRNDLGRIAQTGSVQVPQLFEVDRYGDVLQMTSTIRATLRDGVSLAQIFSALFPCGSITGAPKHRAMQIINELETEKRGWYTGAIGWFDAPRKENAIGDFCLSVSIRTLVLQAPDADGVRRGELGVGAGVVHDSDAQAEYAECALKAEFLTGLRHPFELFETMYATRVAGCRHLDRHLQRLRASAEYFVFHFDEAQLRAALHTATSSFADEGAYRLRLSLADSGAYAIKTAPLGLVPSSVNIMLAPNPVAATDLFLRHKTTVRERYDAAWREAEQHGAFDMLFFNTRGELTEGARSNVFIKQNGKWFTPPIASGLLPGVMRSVILSDQTWNAEEKILTRQDLFDAQQIIICSALRGISTATIIDPLRDTI